MIVEGLIQEGKIVSGSEHLHPDLLIGTAPKEELVIANYKIEIFIGSDRSVFKDVRALICTWLSGGKFNGDNDVGMFWCIDAAEVNRPGAFTDLMWDLKNKRDSNYGCGSLIPPDAVGPDFGICPSCQRKFKATRLTNILPYSGSLTSLVDLLCHFYVKLEESADFYMKYQTGRNIIELTEEAKMWNKQSSKDQINNSPLMREQGGTIESALYPLKNIRKDLMAGASLSGRLTAFLTS